MLLLKLAQETHITQDHRPACLCRKAAYFRTVQRVMMPCGREGNRRFGVAVATRHRLTGLSTHGLTI